MLGLLIGAFPSYFIDHRGGEKHLHEAGEKKAHIAGSNTQGKLERTKYHMQKPPSSAPNISHQTYSSRRSTLAVGRALSAPSIIEHGPRDSRMVALTFDLNEREGSITGFDDKILKFLKKTNTRATFFMSGMWAESHSKEAKLIGTSDLFEIASQAYSDKLFTRMSSEQIGLQISKAQDSINFITGVTPRYFRFPYGKYNQASVNAVYGSGLKPIQWDVQTKDISINSSANDIIGTVKQNACGGSIIEMHANGKGWHTAKALPQIIDFLRQNGYELVTVSELLNDN